MDVYKRKSNTKIEKINFELLFKLFQHLHLFFFTDLTDEKNPKNPQKKPNLSKCGNVFRIQTLLKTHFFL